jgi:AraC-like DNA-binding protein
MAGRQAGPVPTIRASVLAPIVRTLDDRGGDTDGLLARHGLARSQLRDPYATVPLRRYVAFLEAAAVQTADPAFGLRLGAMLQPADLGPAGLLFALVPTLRQAVEYMSRYMGTLQSGTALTLQDQDGCAALAYKMEDPSIWPRVQDSELTLPTMCSLIRSRLGAGWAPLEVHFDHAGHKVSQAMRQIFRAPVRFQQPTTQLLIATGELDRPLRPQEAGVLPALERHAQDLLAQEAVTQGVSPASLADQVRRVIAVRVGLDRLSVASIADELGVSGRTLQRGLAAEGLTLRDLLREHRRWLAETRLQSGTASMTQIAHAMGYSDSTVFWRAFKAWSGAPPTAFRRRPE